MQVSASCGKLHHIDCPNNAAARDAALLLPTPPAEASKQDHALLLLSVAVPTQPTRVVLAPQTNLTPQDRQSRKGFSALLNRKRNSADSHAAEMLLSICPSISPKTECLSSPSRMPPAFSLASMRDREENRRPKKKAKTVKASEVPRRKGTVSLAGTLDDDDDSDRLDERAPDGRIGIYLPAQRKALLKRFAEKRKRRRWGKAVRYRCRKNLANNRVRVKGRFVSMKSQAPATGTATALPAAGTALPMVMAMPVHAPMVAAQ